MKLTKTQILTVFPIITFQCVFAQDFINLNFESANFSGNSGGYVSTSAALPDWTAYYGPVNDPTSLNTPIVAYNGMSLGAALVAIQDVNAVYYDPIQGNYSALLQGSSLAAATTASIGQTGTIPSMAQSLTFFAYVTGTVLVSFNGQNLPFSAIGSGANYTIYGADISSFAGHTGQLLFTAPIQNSALLDNIQFSPSSVPEPSELALGALGALIFGFRRWRNS